MSGCLVSLASQPPLFERNSTYKVSVGCIFNPEANVRPMQDKPDGLQHYVSECGLSHETLAVIGFDRLPTRLHGHDHVLFVHD